MKKFLITLSLITVMTLQIQFPLTVEAAKEDDELSIMAAEQREINDADVTVKDEVETFDNKPPIPENNNDNKPTEQNNSGNDNNIVEKKTNDSDVTTNINASTDKNVVVDTTVSVDNKVSINNNVEKQVNNDVSMPNPIVHYPTFEEAAKKLGYIPLYIPKKSGYSMNYISVINNKIAEIRYDRRWEPTVTLLIRTYKRSPGEELKDISGINGIKWKVDLSTGMTIYIARVSDKVGAAAWSVGQYTFAAMAENLSFAAFHSLVVEELVDLCKHYFITLN